MSEKPTRKSGCGQGRVLRPDDKRLRDNIPPEVRKQIGQKGGSKLAQNREHMRRIGRIGGAKTSSIPGHLKRIGSIGGSAARANKTAVQEPATTP